MNVFRYFAAELHRVIEALTAEGALPPGLDVSRIGVGPPREASHGDLATNAAMVLAKPAGQNPRALAALLVPRLEQHPEVASAEVAGPGFINLRLAPSVWLAELGAILRAGTA